MNNRVRELRLAREWSQQQLGERLGVSRQTVISIENGRYDPSLPLAAQIRAIRGAVECLASLPEPHDFTQ